MTLTLLLAWALLAPPAPANSNTITPTVPDTTATRLERTVRRLASPEFMGRAPGTAGEDKTTGFLLHEFRALGLKAQLQDVPVLGVSTLPYMRAQTPEHEPQRLVDPEDFVAVTHRGLPAVDVKVDSVVFVGYGIVAPEYHWDDYAGVDVKDKVVVALIGEPAATPKTAPDFFEGDALTYYARWIYKRDLARQRGAAGILFVHDDATAGYGYDVVKSGWTQEQLSTDGRSPVPPLAFEGWLSNRCARRLFTESGYDLSQASYDVTRAEHAAIILPVALHVHLENKVRRFTSHNVMARLEGEDPNHHLIYSAHWDHFGQVVDPLGTHVFAGAGDNASGVAEVLEIARNYAQAPAKPKNTLVFLFTTGEEQGLLGAQWYAEHAPLPLDRALASINLDIMNMWGKTRSIVHAAYGHSEMDGALQKVAAAQGRRVLPDPEPGKAYYYRSDHIEWVKRGVPAAFFLLPGADYVGRDGDFALQKRAEYIRSRYHKPEDVVADDWDFGGAEQDVALMTELGREIMGRGGRLRIYRTYVWP